MPPDMDLDMEAAWNLARESTRLVRQRRNLLYTFGDTRLPYVCLATSRESGGGLLAYEGTVSAQRPHIALPGEDGMRFEGFGDGPGEDGPGPPPPGPGGEGLWIRIARRFALPAAGYVNEAGPARPVPGPLEAALDRETGRLDGENDIRTAVLSADRRVWRLGVLLYAASQMARSAESNIREHLERRMAGHGRR